MSKYLLLLLFTSTILVACSQSPSATTAPFDTPVANQVEDIHQETDHQDDGHGHVQSSQATSNMEVVLVASELVVGPNRFAVGLFDGEGRAIQEATVHFHYYDLSDPAAPVLETEADATPLHTPDGRTTIFAQERAFNRTGDWGVEVQARFPDGTAALKRIGFEVLAESPTLKPGQKAPSLETPTTTEVNGDLGQLTSARTPNPAFYESSLAQAISSGKPTVLLFATPAFCQTRFCGPAYDLTSELQKQYGGAFNFVHVEVYTGLPDPAANDWQLAPSMAAFGLVSEPWLYLIDATGTIAYRVEGLFTAAEVERHLQAVLDT